MAVLKNCFLIKYSFQNNLRSYLDKLPDLTHYLASRIEGQGFTSYFGA